MPIVSCPIMETLEHVVRPIVEQSAHRLITMLNVEDVIGDSIYINSEFMAKTQTSTLTKNAIVNVDALRVDLSPQINPTSQKWDSIYTFAHTAAYGINRNMMSDSIPIYKDLANNVRVVEIVAPVTLALQCTFQVKSANIAYHLPYELYQTFGVGKLPFYQDLFYDYPIPKAIVHTLYEIYKIDRIYGKPTGITFGDYIGIRTGHVWSVTQNSYHENEWELVQNVRDLQVLTTVEYNDDKPNAEKRGDSPAMWEVPVTMTVQFSAPQIAIMFFPITICNTLVPGECIPTEKVDRYNRLTGHHRWDPVNRYRVEDALTGHNSRVLPNVYAHIPHYDDWVPEGLPPLFKHGQKMILIIGVTLDEDSPRYLTTLDFNTYKDANYYLKPYVYEILVLERNLAVYEDSLITISVFDNHRQLLPGYSVNIKDLVVQFEGIKLTDQYHVVISICYDLYKLNKYFYFLLDWYYKFFDPVLQKQIDTFIEEGLMKPPYTLDDVEHGNIFDGDGNWVGNLNDPTLNRSDNEHGVLK